MMIIKVQKKLYRNKIKFVKDHVSILDNPKKEYLGTLFLNMV